MIRVWVIKPRGLFYIVDGRREDGRRNDDISRNEVLFKSEPCIIIID